MQDTRRILVAFLLVFVVLFLWTTLTAKKKPQVASPVATQQAPAVQPAQPQQPAPAAVKPVLPQPRAPEKFDTLENQDLRVVLSSYGGTIVSVWLKKYKAQLVPDGSRFNGLGLLHGRDYFDLAEQEMTVWRSGEALEYTTVVSDSAAVASPLEITRRYELADGYLLNTTVRMVGPNSGYLLMFRNGTALTEPNKNEDLAHVNLLVSNQRLQRLGTKQIKNELQLNGRFSWVAGKSMYFLVALLGRPTQLDTVIAGTLADRRIGWLAGVKGNRTDDRFQLCFAPLEYNLLRHNGLEPAFDFGKFLGISLKWIGLPILKFLQWVFLLVRNFGVAIVVFAIVMKAIFFPLSRMQYKQMRSMAMLQPKLDELKKRYKNDAEGLNRETMQLYRLYKVNPFTGCLPLLIQMPVFFAMYQVLRISVDLRQATFMFWIRDLSLKDPYYLLPILMGVFSIAQSLITSAGQKQNKLLTFMMPVFITVIFLNFPSGLQLYWLVFNILSIIESLIAQGGLKWQKKSRQAQPATP